MKIEYTDTDIVELLQILKEKKQKHKKLYGLAKERSDKPEFKKNAEKLMSKHTAKQQRADKLIQKIVEQL